MHLALCHAAATLWEQLGAHKNQISAAKEILTVLTLIPAACWAVFIFRNAKKKEEASRAQQLFASFYLSAEFGQLRHSLEFDYDKTLRPLIERVMRPDETEFSSVERKSLCDLDLALNHFEFVLHLEEQRQIDSEDRRALFGYWYEWLSKPDRAEIRRYIREYGYAALTRLLAKIQADRFSRCTGQLIAFYGTLREGCGGGEEALLKKGMNSLGTCRIRGKLIDLGSWPGLLEGEGIVKADLYQMLEGDLARIDEHEGNDFRRRRVCLVDPESNAWVYFYVGEDSGPVLPGGDWMNRKQQTTP
jgi:gamma-glutamylcyclotransferase (GGCT)/AIG2-like uncharacterized protein YtfP